MPGPDTTLCVLLYGDYPDLAARCLESTRPLWQSGRVRLRVGANAPCAATRHYLATEVLPSCEQSVVSSDNLLKYPVMSRLFWDPPLTTPLVQWWDDDSFLRPGIDPVAWLARLERAMAGPPGADLRGSVYTINLAGNQHRWVESRPWYAGKPVARGQAVRFATGGWWCARTEALARWRWPDVEVLHRGGDVMLGELYRQQALRLEHDREGVAVNADAGGRESRSTRRGFDEKPVGYHYHGDVEATQAALAAQSAGRRSA